MKPQTPSPQQHPVPATASPAGRPVLHLRRPLSDPSPFLVRTYVLSDGSNKGERLPVLIDKATGFPVSHVLQYALSRRRSQLASSSMAKELRALGLVYEWAGNQNPPIDLVERMLSGRGFSQSEIETGLWQALRANHSQLKGRRRIVLNDQVTFRLMAARRYFDWGLAEAVSRASLAREPEKVAAYEAVRARLFALLSELMPGQDPTPQILGLTPDQAADLLDAIRPDSPRNPWRGPSAALAPVLRARNEFLINLMVRFGPRRGDLLKLYVSDVHLGHGYDQVSICRRPDDPADPRVVEPNAKTQPRDLPLAPDMADMLEAYLRDHHRKIPNSKKTPYLVLAADTGVPLSARGFNEIFEGLQKIVPGVHPHKLRHTAMEGLLREGAQKGLDRTTLDRHARYLAGWLTDNLSRYAQREIQLQVRDASLAYQSSLMGGRNGAR